MYTDFFTFILANYFRLNSFLYKSPRLKPPFLLFDVISDKVHYYGLWWAGHVITHNGGQLTISMYGTGMEPVLPSECFTVHHSSSSLWMTTMMSPFLKCRSSGSSCRQNKYFMLNQIYQMLSFWWNKFLKSKYHDLSIIKAPKMFKSLAQLVSIFGNKIFKNVSWGESKFLHLKFLAIGYVRDNAESKPWSNT